MQALRMRRGLKALFPLDKTRAEGPTWCTWRPRGVVSPEKPRRKAARRLPDTLGPPVPFLLHKRSCHSPTQPPGNVSVPARHTLVCSMKCVGGACASSFAEHAHKRLGNTDPTTCNNQEQSSPEPCAMWLWYPRSPRGVSLALGLRPACAG